MPNELIPWEIAAPLISHFESGDRNVFNYLHDTAPNYYTAGGYYQIVDSTWREGAKAAGVDTSQYPTAISAPRQVQDQVARALYDRYQFGPWKEDARLMQAIGRRQQAPAPAPGPVSNPLAGMPQVAPAQAQPTAPTSAQPAAPAGPNPMVALQLLQLAAPNHKLVPVDYDPWAVAAASTPKSAA